MRIYRRIPRCCHCEDDGDSGGMGGMGGDSGGFSGGTGDSSVGDGGGYSGGGDLGGSDAGGGFSSLGSSALSGIQSAMSDLGISYGTGGAFSAMGEAAAAGLDRGSQAASYGFGLTEGKYAAEIAAGPLSQSIAGAITGEPTSFSFTDKGMEPTGQPTNWSATSQGKEAIGKANQDIAAERSFLGSLRDYVFGYDRTISPAGLNALMAAGNTIGQGKDAFAAGMAQTSRTGEIEADPMGVMSSILSPIASMIGFGPVGLMVDGPKPSTALSVYNSISDLSKLSAISGAISNPATAVSPGVASENSGVVSGTNGYAGSSNQSEIVGNLASSDGTETLQGGSPKKGLMPTFNIDTKVRTGLPTKSLIGGLGKFGDDFNLLNLAKSLRG